jgi:spore germination protein YaaH
MTRFQGLLARAATALLLGAGLPERAAAAEPPLLPPGFAPPASIHEVEWLAHRGKPLPEPELSLPRVAPLEASSRAALRKTVFGFLPYWKVADLTRVKWDLLSHVAYFSVDVNADGSIANQAGSYAWPSGAYVSSLREAARTTGVKVVLTATNMSGSSIAALLGSSAAREAAISNLVALVQGHGDGVNVDFEGVPAAQRENLVTFLRDLAQAMHAAVPGSHVSLCTPAVDWSSAFDFDALASACDGLFVMAYDYHWRSGPEAGPCSPLAGGTPWSKYAVTWTVDDYLAKVSAGNRGKVILGLPHYGYEWPTATTSVPSATTGAGSSMTYDAARSNAALHGRIWDAASQTPYYVHASGGAHQGWYDDAESLGRKWDLVVARDLGGTGIWAIGYATSDDLLWDGLRARFAAAPCTLACSASAPGDGRAGESLPFVASAVPADCAGAASPAWSFGDGATSAEWSPTHAYAAPGTYEWTFVASVGGTRCEKAGRVVVSEALPAAFSSVLPSSAFRSGRNGAEFRTDVRVLNPGTAAVTVTPVFYDQASGAVVAAGSFPLAARRQAAFDNVLASLFGRTLEAGAFGPIRFDATGPLVVSASVNNVNACGSGAVSGQWLPGLDASAALTSAVIPQVAVSVDSTAGYRTNLVVVNPSSGDATVSVTVRRGDGTLLSSATIGPLPPNGFRQAALDDVATFPGLLGVGDANLWIELSSDRPVLAFTSVIHNVSGDPYAVVALPVAP